MPIGTGAMYVPAHIAQPTAKTLISDEDIIVMDPTAPMTLLMHSGAGWGGGNRCTASGPSLISVPMPTGFEVPSNGHNDALAVVMPDGQTVVQGQPFARCTPTGPATVMELAPSDNLYGDGILGARVRRRKQDGGQRGDDGNETQGAEHVPMMPRGRVVLKSPPPCP